ncbi:uncharacterized protein LOC134336606 [Mobula hypostoma]|uniref:uncharacterized protein LOC134336606 n=1 Tax=Mobula hypostoma TaxID=723540 RepID=UPI002FC29779
MLKSPITSPLSCSNLTPSERTAFHSLRSNPNLTIKHADKGGAVVVWQTNLNLTEVKQQHSDTSSYLQEASTRRGGGQASSQLVFTMSPETVMCLSCEMWQSWGNSPLPQSHICQKCIRLGDLEDRVWNLEQQLDDLRLIRENEAVIDESYREVVTPRLSEAGRWVTVKGGKAKVSRQVVQSTPVAIPLNNKFTVLDTTGRDDRPGVSHGGRASGTESDPVVQKGGTEKRRAVVIGDSILREADRRFCGREKDTRMVCCLPGARVRDVSDRVHDILVQEGKQPEVVIHVGTNDIGTKRDEVLKCEFREFGRRLKNRTSRVTFSGLLPVLRDRDDAAQLAEFLQRVVRR